MADINIKSIIMLLLCISILFNLFGFNLIKYDTGTDLISNFFDSDGTTAQSIKLNGNTTELITDITNPSENLAGGGVGSLIDIIIMIGGFLILLANIVLTPLAIMVGIPGLPYEVAMMIGVPLVLVYIISLVYFIRGLN